MIGQATKIQIQRLSNHRKLLRVVEIQHNNDLGSGYPNSKPLCNELLVNTT